MAPTESGVIISQCGGGSMVDQPKKEKEEEDKPQEQEKKEHCWTCTDEFHSRGEVDRSRESFDWKVVEPFDGKLRNCENYDVF